MSYLHVYTIIEHDDYDSMQTDLELMSNLCVKIRKLANEFDYIYLATYAEQSVDPEQLTEEHAVAVELKLDVKDKELSITQDDGYVASILLTDSKCEDFVIEEMRNIILNDIVRMLQIEDIP